MPIQARAPRYEQLRVEIRVCEGLVVFHVLNKMTGDDRCATFFQPAGMIKFILMVNKQGQTRLAQYYDFLTVKERVALEGELIRKCLSRHEGQCSFLEYRGYKIIYRRYASLYFIVGVDDDECENELGYLEFIHSLVETLDRYFENVCELDIMFNIEKAHIILDEMVANGYIVEMNKTNILNPLGLMDKFADSS